MCHICSLTKATSWKHTYLYHVCKNKINKFKKYKSLRGLSYFEIYVYIYIYIERERMADISKSEKMKISGKIDKSNGFNSNILFFNQRRIKYYN